MHKILDFLDDSESQEEEELQKNPIPMSSLNIKNGIMKYKMKLKEKKKIDDKNSEKNSKMPYVINSKGKWNTEKEAGKKFLNTFNLIKKEDNQEYINSNYNKSQKNNFELKINVQNIKLKNQTLQNLSKEKVYQSSSINNPNNNNTFNRHSSIKGNLFRNTGKNIKNSKFDEDNKFDSKNFNIIYNEKEYENIVNSDFAKNPKFNNQNNNIFGEVSNQNLQNENISKFNCNFDNTSLDGRLPSSGKLLFIKFISIRKKCIEYKS